MDKQDRQEMTYAATIGFFDGVHRGHQYLIGQLKELAAGHGMATMAVTFATHPRRVLQSDWQPQLLSTTDEKLRLLQATGIDRIEVLAFDRQMAALPARDFMAQVLRDRLGVSLLLTGYDNRFGCRRQGEGFADYVAYGRELGIGVVQALPLVGADGRGISSSLVRQCLSEGRVADARQCLGRPYALQGRVVDGCHIGRQMGFPTANLQIDDPQKMLPLAGAYAVYACLDDGREHVPAMMNIGMRPTFDGQQQTIEVHLLHFSGDLYGRRLTVELVERLRGERRFASADELSAQLMADAGRAEELLKPKEN